MNFITIENKGGKVSLNDTVNPASINRMIEEMNKVFGALAAQNGTVTGEITASIENAADTLCIEINSPGGSVFDGYRVFHAIKAMQQRGVYVVAKINSLAASMASVIAMAADKVQMVTGGRMMIHEASQGIHGDAADHARAAKILDEISSEIASIYAAKTGATQEAMRALMKQETWMGTVEAKALGFIDEIITGDTTKNSVDIANTESISADMSFLDRLTSPSDAEAKDRIVALELQITMHDQSVIDLQAKLDIAETALQEASGLAVLNKSLTDTVSAKEVTITAHVATIADLTEKATITEAKISEHAATLLAAQGHGKALNLGKGDITEDVENSKTLADFNAMTPHDRMNFIKAGGTLN